MQDYEKRRFECDHSGHNKFWEIWLEHHRVVTHYGKIGTNGQNVYKDFPTSLDGIIYIEKMIREKLNKGYEEALEYEFNRDVDLAFDTINAYLNEKRHNGLLTGRQKIELRRHVNDWNNVILNRIMDYRLG